MNSTDIFRRYIKDNGLQMTGQRMAIAEVFFRSSKHLSVEELYTLLRKKRIPAGRATVFRTLKLLRESGLAEELDLGDRTRRYEAVTGSGHHDHLICKSCGKCIEIQDGTIERIQRGLCEKHGFAPEDHRLDIFGMCRECEAERNRKG